MLFSYIRSEETLMQTWAFCFIDGVRTGEIDIACHFLWTNRLVQRGCISDIRSRYRLFLALAKLQNDMRIIILLEEALNALHTSRIREVFIDEDRGWLLRMQRGTSDRSFYENIRMYPQVHIELSHCEMSSKKFLCS